MIRYEGKELDGFSFGANVDTTIEIYSSRQKRGMLYTNKDVVVYRIITNDDDEIGNIAFTNEDKQKLIKIFKEDMKKWS